MTKLEKDRYFVEKLIQTNRRLVNNTNCDDSILLNKNELPFEIDSQVKKVICEQLESKDWNRYPTPYYPDLEESIADYAGVEKENIVVGAGAAYFITLLFNVFSNKQIVIPNPSFSLFSFHCNSYGLDYIYWDLNEEYGYDLKLFPQIKEDSIVVIDSPNNPTGSCISEESLQTLLEMHPYSIFLIDEVYFEFSNRTFKSLIDDFENVIIIRSFSKALGLAGVRLGYLIASGEMAKELKKLVLPFIVNHFGYVAAKQILTDEEVIKDLQSKIQQTIQLKGDLISELQNHAKLLNFKIINGLGNFFLMKFENENQLNKSMRLIERQGIKVLDMSKHPKLKNTIRISVGNKRDNDKLIETLSSIK